MPNAGQRQYSQQAFCAEMVKSSRHVQQAVQDTPRIAVGGIAWTVVPNVNANHAHNGSITVP